MNEKDFEAGHGDVLETLRTARGECPAAGELMDWMEGGFDGGQAGTIEQHVTLCSHCADVVERAGEPDPQVDDLGWQRTARRLDARPAAWNASRPGLRTRWLSVAAAAFVAVAVLVINLPDDATRSPAEVATTRDAGVVLLDPRGPVRTVETFRWQGIPAPVLYRIEVKAVGDSPDSAEPLWSGVTSDTRLRGDDALLAALEAREALQWRVVVLDEEGYELGRSGWVAFELTP